MDARHDLDWYITQLRALEQERDRLRELIERTVEALHDERGTLRLITGPFDDDGKRLLHVHGGLHALELVLSEALSAGAR